MPNPTRAEVVLELIQLIVDNDGALQATAAGSMLSPGAKAFIGRAGKMKQFCLASAEFTFVHTSAKDTGTIGLAAGGGGGGGGGGPMPPPAPPKAGALDAADDAQIAAGMNASLYQGGGKSPLFSVLF